MLNKDILAESRILLMEQKYPLPPICAPRTKHGIVPANLSKKNCKVLLNKVARLCFNSSGGNIINISLKKYNLSFLKFNFVNFDRKILVAQLLDKGICPLHIF